MEPLALGALLAGGAGLAGAAVWAAVKYTRGAAAPAADEPVTLEIIADDPPPAPRAVPVVIAPAAPPAPPVAPPRPAPAPTARLPPSSPRSHPERAPAMILTQGVQMQDDAFSRARAAPRAPPPTRAPAPPMRTPPPLRSWAQEVMATTPAEVPTEWARRQVGPIEPGRTAGACGGCGQRLSVSSQRPLRIACPVCGRTKILA